MKVPSYRVPAIVDEDQESGKIARALQDSIEAASPGSNFVMVPAALADLIVCYLRPFGDMSLEDFGPLTKTEQNIVAILIKHSPRLVSTADVLRDLERRGLAMQLSTLNVHKFRILVKLSARNAENKKVNDAAKTTEPRLSYSYIVGMRGSGYGIVRSEKYYTFDELPSADFGVHLL